MAAVAGALAAAVGEDLLGQCREVVVENGGDVFIRNREPMVVALYAGSSPLSRRVGLQFAAAVTRHHQSHRGPPANDGLLVARQFDQTRNVRPFTLTRQLRDGKNPGQRIAGLALANLELRRSLRPPVHFVFAHQPQVAGAQLPLTQLSAHTVNRLGVFRIISQVMQHVRIGSQVVQFFGWL